MKLSDIFINNGIEDLRAIRAEDCLPRNQRLHGMVPEGCYAIFMLFPYYVKNKNSRLAAFASVPDYHQFSRELFAQAEEYVKGKYENAFARGFADHSPYDERDGAAKCGLGVIGRHGLIITEKYSSFVCIGEFVCSLTEEELAAEGIEVRCGEIKYCENCGKCVANCPGKCADGDKFTCISAINQKKGELTEEEQDAVMKSGSIWGCDVCQLSCPHTERAMKNGTLYTKIPFFCENVILGDESDVEALTDEEYARYTFSYRKRNVMKRNIDIIRRGRENG